MRCSKESATEAVPNLRPLRPVWIKVTSHIDAIQKNVLDAMQRPRLCWHRRWIHGWMTSRNCCMGSRRVHRTSHSSMPRTRCWRIRGGEVQSGARGFQTNLEQVGRRVVQRDQAVKHLAATIEQDMTALGKRTDALAGKIDADNKVTAEHFNEVNRASGPWPKPWKMPAASFTVSREDDHERRLEETTRELMHVQAQIQTIDKISRISMRFSSRLSSI